MRYLIRRVLYLTAVSFPRLFWRLAGRRTIRALGESFSVTPETIFPTYRKFPLPAGDCLSEIVRYTDYVQLHAICKLLMDLRTERPLIVEVGAHHGAYALVMGKLVKAKGGRVIAIEPDPQSFGILQRNVALNGLEGVVTCLNLAVSDAAGRQRFAQAGSQSSLACTDSAAGCVVDVAPLSQLLAGAGVGHVDLLIIDVEGAELPVLRGFPWETTTVGTIFCELHPYAWRSFGYSGADLFSFLRERNYRLLDMYFKEYTAFETDAYIGPVLFLREPSADTMGRCG